MKIYLFDSLEAHENLLPLSFTRPLADFRCGILTIIEKWQKLLPGDYAFYPVEYLREKYGTIEKSNDDTLLFIAGNLLPDREIVDFIQTLEENEVVKYKEHPVLFKGTFKDFESKKWTEREREKNLNIIEFVFDIFLKNGEEIKKDFDLITKGRKSAPLPSCVRALDCGNKDTSGEIFIEEGAEVECATLNTSEGPIYIGKDSVLLEGACIRGPFALCEGAEVRMGSKIYEATTIGPHCKAGGEISNTIFFGYSNKAHDGYLGNSVIGEWCNIGAGANASNLKNDYSLIRVWNYRTKSFMRTDLQFCGLIMGDHSKVGVNCMINTATVMGVGVNLHGAGFPRTFLPCFSEGSPTSGFTQVPFKKFIDVAQRVMSRREMAPSESDISLLHHIYEKV